MQGTPPTSDSIQRRRRRWGRKRPPEAESAAYIAVAPFPQAGTADRFRPPSLRPVEAKKGRRAARERGRDSKEGATAPRTRLRPWRTLDKVLLVVEVVGALVIAWLVWQYVYTVYFDTAPRRVTPTRTATAGVFLPGGQSPTATTTAKPSPTRFVEVAPPLEGTPGVEDDSGVGGPPVSSTKVAIPTATATATADPQALLPVRLRIPAMSLDSPVHEVTVNMGEWQVSPMDIGHHYGTGNPGEIGNVVLAGHRDINSALFRELDRLGPDDDIYVSNSLGEYHYRVTESYVVGPDHTEVMASTDDKRVTLITCTPIGLATQRLIVVAVLDETAR
ncbi:MAG TPA: sortase [Chloroflexia bacterium]|nr:sortase [Chloroflexia bacterium]